MGAPKWPPYPQRSEAARLSRVAPRECARPAYSALGVAVSSNEPASKLAHHVNFVTRMAPLSNAETEIVS
jgi:hypothetical protein